MTVRQNGRLVIMAVLALAALLLTSGYVLHNTSPRTPRVVTTAGFPGPDARDRNEQIAAGQKSPEDTHGH
ncbi:MAG TPA: hypothetical protein VHO95_06310 [Candidatus Dormibacteraeota bacterium]|nr:hypothetical protein [Candidatus Dormibacteraeota bacterium]